MILSIDKSWPAFTPNSNLDKFNSLFNLTQTGMGVEQLDAMFTLKKAIDLRILYEKQGAYNYPRPEGLIVIGENKAEAIEFILSPKKEVIVSELENSIKAKSVY